MKLSIKKANSAGDWEEVHDQILEAFSHQLDFDWKLENLKGQALRGWVLYWVQVEKEIVAAILVKTEGTALLTKHTSTKLAFQGKGISHAIKRFLEMKAHKDKLEKIITYSRVDDFRMISLNETHGYKRTGKKRGQKVDLEEWEKTLEDI